MEELFSTLRSALWPFWTLFSISNHWWHRLEFRRSPNQLERLGIPRFQHLDILCTTWHYKSLHTFRSRAWGQWYCCHPRYAMQDEPLKQSWKFASLGRYQSFSRCLVFPYRTTPSQLHILGFRGHPWKSIRLNARLRHLPGSDIWSVSVLVVSSICTTPPNSGTCR